MTPAPSSQSGHKRSSQPISPVIPTWQIKRGQILLIRGDIPDAYIKRYRLRGLEVPWRPALVLKVGLKSDELLISMFTSFKGTEINKKFRDHRRRHDYLAVHPASPCSCGEMPVLRLGGEKQMPRQSYLDYRNIYPIHSVMLCQLVAGQEHSSFYLEQTSFINATKQMQTKSFYITPSRYLKYMEVPEALAPSDFMSANSANISGLAAMMPAGSIVRLQSHLEMDESLVEESGMPSESLCGSCVLVWRNSFEEYVTVFRIVPGKAARELMDNTENGIAKCHVTPIAPGTPQPELPESLILEGFWMGNMYVLTNLMYTIHCQMVEVVNQQPVDIQHVTDESFYKFACRIHSTSGIENGTEVMQRQQTFSHLPFLDPGDVDEDVVGNTVAAASTIKETSSSQQATANRDKIKARIIRVSLPGAQNYSALDPLGGNAIDSVAEADEASSPALPDSSSNPPSTTMETAPDKSKVAMSPDSQAEDVESSSQRRDLTAYRLELMERLSKPRLDSIHDAGNEKQHQRQERILVGIEALIESLEEIEGSWSTI